MAFKAQLGIKWCTLVLFILPFSACMQSHTQVLQKEQGSTRREKSVNDQLIVYADSLAGRFRNKAFNQEQFKALTDSFALYIPVVVLKAGESAPENTVIADMRLSGDTAQADVIALSLPYSIGFTLNFKSITDHFGQPGKEGPLFRQHKSPPPIKIDLSNHFMEQRSPVSLYVRAAHFPDEVPNQIVHIELVRTKD